jgi:hypothetical protein
MPRIGLIHAPVAIALVEQEAVVLAEAEVGAGHDLVVAGGVWSCLHYLVAKTGLAEL